MRAPGLILLAAGGSTRMGRPKQLLPWNGRSLLRHACEVALATSCDPVIVVLGCEAEACALELKDLDVIPAINAQWQKGMGTSVATGITALEKNAPDATGVLLMLVDQPTVTSSLLQSLVTRWSPLEASIVAMKYPEGGGVPALFDRAYFAALRALDADRGARGIISREKSRIALIDPKAELIDLDTPQAYQTSVSA